MRFQRSFYVPRGAVKIRVKDLPGCEVYFYERAGAPCALVFKGRAEKPLSHHRYQSADRRAAHCAAVIENLRAHEAAKSKRRAEKSKGHDAKPGDIFCSSWGYEQTNVDFYQVVGVSKCSVSLRKISAAIEENGFMSGKAVPVADDFQGEAFTVRCGPDLSVKIGYKRAHFWDGKAKYVSWYH